MPHRRGRTRRPVRSRARPAASPQGAHTRRSSCRSPLATQVRCCEARGTRCIEARFNRSGAPTSARARAHVRPNLPVSEPSSGLLTKYGSKPKPDPDVCPQSRLPLPVPVAYWPTLHPDQLRTPTLRWAARALSLCRPCFRETRDAESGVSEPSPSAPSLWHAVYILCTRCLLRDFCRKSLFFCPVIRGSDTGY